jgi:hypothetical protein
MLIFFVSLYVLPASGVSRNVKSVTLMFFVRILALKNLFFFLLNSRV